MHVEKKDQRTGEDEEEEDSDRERMKSGAGLGDGVYLCPVHWIMDDSCLRFLEEECRRKEMEEKRGRKGKKENRI